MHLVPDLHSTPPDGTEDFESAPSNTESAWGSGTLQPQLRGPDAEARPDAFALGGSTPHPVRGTALLRYALPEAAEVDITLYDVMGRVVRRLVSGSRPAGFHQVSVDASGLPSGVYFCRMQAGSFTETRRLVLVK